MKKIKVAQIITRMDWGGSPDIVRIICQRLDPKKYDVKLIYGFTRHASLVTSNFLNKFSGNIICIPSLRRKVNLFYDFLAFISLYRLFRREKFDIVQANTSKAGALARVAAKLAGVPVTIYFSHGHIFYGYFKPLVNKFVVLIERFLALFTTKFIALTELEREDLVAYKVAKHEKITVINSGLELDIYKKVTKRDEKKRKELGLGPEIAVVGMVGRLEPIKNPRCLIEAAKLIAEDYTDVKFLVIGEGSLRPGLEARCKKLGIWDKFKFLGWREDVPEIISVLDLLILPSLNEAVGRVIIEAAACSVPTIASNVGGIPEVIKDNQTGLLVPPRNVKVLASAVTALLKDKEVRQVLGEEAKKWVDYKFSAEFMVERIVKLYEELVNVS